MKKFVLATLSFVAALAGFTVVAASPASAQSCEVQCHGTIISPTDGATLNVGDSPHVVVDFGSETGTHNLVITGPGGYRWGGMTDGSAWDYSTTDPITTPGTYEFRITLAGATGATVSHFTVVGSPEDPPPTGTGTCSWAGCAGMLVSPTDGSTIDVVTKTSFTVSVDFSHNPDGSVPQQSKYNDGFYASLDEITEPDNDFYCSGGHTDVNGPVTLRCYVRETATAGPKKVAVLMDAGGTARRTSAYLTINVHRPIGHYENVTTTYYENVRKVIKKNGTQASSTSRSGCSIYRSHWEDSDLFLDCWGGRYAKAVYNFSVPSNAYNISKSHKGEAYCCSAGTITKAWTHPTSTSYKFTAKVTGWRAYDIVSVTLSYWVKVKRTKTVQVWVCDQYCDGVA